MIKRINSGACQVNGINATEGPSVSLTDIGGLQSGIVVMQIGSAWYIVSHAL